MPNVYFAIDVTCDSEQPYQMVAAAASAAVRSVLEGWTDDVQVTLVASGRPEEN